MPGCLYPTVFRDAIIFEDAAFLEMQTFYRYLGDAYISESSEMLSFQRYNLFSGMQTFNRALIDAYIPDFRDASSFKDTNISESFKRCLHPTVSGIQTF